MDEPTSVLTEQETEDLFLSLKKFSKEGIFNYLYYSQVERSIITM